MEDERSTAYHEAGHAVVCYRLGGDFHGVDIIRDGPRLGAATGGFSDDRTAAPSKAYAVMCYAGRAAEAVLRGEPFEVAFPAELTYSGGEEEDRLHAEESLAKVGDPAALAPRYQRLALWLVRRRWRDIESVADALLTHKRLTYDEVGILLDDGRDKMEAFRAVFLADKS
jgi:hypothetical protein